MITLKNIRENKALVTEKLELKNYDISKIDEIINKDTIWRSGIAEVEKLKEDRNKASKKISEYKRDGKSADEIILEMQKVSSEIKKIDSKNIKVKDKIDQMLLDIPNIPHDSVPFGEDELSNKIVRTWGEKPEFNFKLQGHVEIAEQLKLINFKAGAVMSGTGFPVYTNLGARLERALINFMLDYHTKNEYTEIFPPFLVARDSMQTTGQLPKFMEDMYHMQKDDLFCIPTAEVPVTNYYKGQEINESLLPIKFAAYSACFRREAGSYGKETRGLLRLHQFNKVELVKFTSPDSSYEELELLLNDAEKILQILGLHYRVIELCTGDLSFSAAKCYDIEVWSPFEEKYLEVSSCSNFESFQSRRGNIRYRSSNTGKMIFPHTLNGSGVATPRLMVALIESYQEEDGSIQLPEPLQKYFNKDSITLDA